MLKIDNTYIKSFLKKAKASKIDRLKALDIEATLLDRTDLYESSWNIDLDVVQDMITLLSKIDLSKLSGQARDKIEVFEEEIEGTVHISYKDGDKREGSDILIGDWNKKEKRYWNLTEKLIFVRNRLNAETQFKKQMTDSQMWQKKGELHGSNEALEQAKDLIIELIREYVHRETTNVLQYKLRL